ncbi:MAG: cache domain-containing protein, partial [Coxiellaceae bacterium]|nr:cache domain-containing protein [Coxiellaceae bacterium]
MKKNTKASWISKLSNTLRPRQSFKISLQFSMLSIFLTLFILTMMTIIAVTTYRLYESMIIISKQQMDQVTTMVTDQLNAQLHPAEGASNLTKELIQNNILDINNTNQMLNYTVELLDTLPDAAMVYWGDQEGNFIISRQEPDGTLSSEIISRKGGKAVSTFIKRDKDKNVIEKKVTADVTYDPRKRPWYITAAQLKETTWSNPYIFFTGKTRTLGITSAAPMFNTKDELVGVVGIDMKLDVISKFLDKLRVGKSGDAFIVDKDGQLIAHPDLIELTGDDRGDEILPIK